MKYKVLASLVIGAGLMVGCDKVEFPLETGNDAGSGGGGSQDVVTQNVMIEEFTGQGCGNCPGAAVIAKDLSNFYGEGRVVVVTIHAGWFATGANPWASSSDLMCTPGEDIDQSFGVGNAGNPNGLINRKEINGNYIVPPSSWDAEVGDIVNNQTPKVGLSITATEGGGNISAEIDVTYEEDLTGDHYLVVAVTENNIVTWQKNYAGTGDPSYPVGDVPDYKHDHILRGHMNGTWGSQVVTGSVSSGTTETYNHSMAVDGSWDSGNLNVIAYIYDAATQEIVNVEEVHLN